ncbi:MAG: hypothetical protein QW364_05705 [Thermoplasmatales archaeon]
MSEDLVKKKIDYKVFIVVGIVVLAGVLVYMEYPEIVVSSRPTITILTYPSFFQYGANPNATLKYIIGNFERWYNVNVRIVTSSGDLYQQVVESHGKGYDIVIGLNNIDSYLAARSGLFYRFNVSNESYLNETIFSFIQGNGYAVPYEYSALTTDYNFSGPIPMSIVENLSYQDLYNSTIGKQYIVENPVSSINGQDFLLGEIAFYENILGQNWTLFWKNSKGIVVTEDWDSGFKLFEDGSEQMFFSYQTDPSYNQYFNYSKIGTTPFHFDGKDYAWIQVLSLGILNSSKYKSLDEEFVNWFLGSRVQSLIPLNEWMYPANIEVKLPQVYSVNPPISEIIPLNEYLNISQVAKSLPTWILEWNSIE